VCYSILALVKILTCNMFGRPDDLKKQVMLKPQERSYVDWCSEGHKKKSRTISPKKGNKCDCEPDKNSLV